MKKNVLLRLIGRSMLVLAVSAVMILPVNAEKETGTAGSNFGKGEIIAEEEEGIAFYADQETGAAAASEDGEDETEAQSELPLGWNKNATGWWYNEGDGNYPALSWRKIDGTWYYFNSSGYWVDDNTYESGTLKGIDVSEWQGVIDWQAVKDDGVQFAFVRAGGYGDYLDLYFDRNMKEANAAGVPVGVYFYSTAQNESEALSDAQFVIEHVTGYTVSYPIAIDLEDSSISSLSKTEIGNIAKAFCDEIRAAGYTPMIYTNENWYTNKVDMSQLTDVNKWIARYSNVIDENIPRDIWQCCSTGRVNGIEGNVDINFGYTDFSQIVTPRTEPVEGYKATGGSWAKDGRGWWYRYRDGSYPKNQWETINGKKYWFDADGYMVTGWKKISNKWYYLNSSGAMMTGWVQIKGVWYYLNSNGVMATGWKQIKGTWYYLSSSGAMVTGWLNLNGTWYYLSSSGAMATGWLNLNGTWYYLNDWGGMAVGWKQVNGIWYYLNGSGAMITGWLNQSGTWYYLNDWGGMAVGWKQVNGIWYYLTESGAMATGWLKVNGTWYYLSSSGAMATGWLNLNGTWYYLSSSGAMVTGQQLINNTWYSFNASGAWIG